MRKFFPTKLLNHNPRETLPPNQIITAQSYCDQLDRLNEMLKEKRSFLVNCKGVIYYHNNARTHSARITCSKIEELGWEKLPHPRILPRYCSFRLFRSDPQLAV